MITSLQNRRVKQWRKLHRRKEREKANLFLIEGFHLLEEALKSHWQIKHIILQQGVDLPFSYDEVDLTIVSEEVFMSLSQTETPQGILAVASMPTHHEAKGSYILLVDQVQDPGNLGTMIRTADAAGFSTIILGDGTVDVYNDKVIRATQGSLFHVNILQRDLKTEIENLQKKGYYVLASSLKEADDYKKINVKEKMALIVGNEGAGIQEHLIRKADQRIKIPIYGRAESLNVSIAAGILMYEIRKKLAQ